MSKLSMCFSALAALSAVAHVGVANAADSAQQARIAFADMGGIRNWRADDSGALFVQSRRGQWYRADLASSCSGLPSAHTIGFVFEPDGSFDRFSSIVVDGHECRIRSLVRSEGPQAADKNKPALTATDASAGSAPTSSHSGAVDRGDKEEDGRDREKQASIPFANLGGIENWRAVDDDTLYIEGRNNQWYRAELFGFCPGLQFEHAIGFVAEPIGSFDRFSSIVVDGRECRLKSLTASEPPAKKG